MKTPLFRLYELSQGRIMLTRKTKVSEHFNLGELACKDPILKGKPFISRLPELYMLINFCDTLIYLEELRLYIDKPLILTSVFRDAIYNKKEGGVSKSSHVTFRAADIGNPYNTYVDYKRFYDKCEKVAEHCEKVHGLFIRLGKYKNDGFVHVDTDRSKFAKRWEK